MEILLILFIIYLIFSLLYKAIKSIGGMVLNILAFLIAVVIYLIPFGLVFGFSYFCLQDLDLDTMVLLITCGVFTLLTHLSKSGSIYTISGALMYFIGELIYKYVYGLEPLLIFPIALGGMIILVPLIMHINYMMENAEDFPPRVMYFFEKVGFFNLVSYIATTGLLLLWCVNM